MKAVVVDVLLGVGVGSILLSCLGLLASGGPFEQLHFTGPAATIAPVAIAAAVIVDESTPSSMVVKSVITAVILLVTSPVLVHATARAIRVRRHGRFQILRDELARKENP